MTYNDCEDTNIEKLISKTSFKNIVLDYGVYIDIYRDKNGIKNFAFIGVHKINEYGITNCGNNYYNFKLRFVETMKNYNKSLKNIEKNVKIENMDNYI